MIEEFAPAKINLTLHVTGKREDGYHELNSLVVFADHGDILRFEKDDRLSLAISGPFADDLPLAGNLVLKAASLLQRSDAKIDLEKNIPIAAGLGGGSSDAAAALRGLLRIGAKSTEDKAEFQSILTKLGADIPMCLDPRPLWVEGVGDVLSTAPVLPEFHMVLVNPNVELSTAAVFAELEPPYGAPMEAPKSDLTDYFSFIDWLRSGRNDLQDPAFRLAPIIVDCLAALNSMPHCNLARMSGSGATCFGIFETKEAAGAAAEMLRKEYSHWWIEDVGVWPRPA